MVIALLALISVFAGCSKDDSDKETVSKTTVSTGKEDASDDQSTKPGETEKDNLLIPKSTKAGDIIQFGQYEQDNNTANGKEKIAWRVLMVENGKAFLLADKILECKPFNLNLKEVTWETCTLRAWLNEGFYNAAFTTAEKAMILTTDLVNEDNPEYGTDGGNNTIDKLFLLSYSEATNPSYSFSSDISNADPARQAQGTDFAKDKELLTAIDGSYPGNGPWWVRSPGVNKEGAGFIDCDGNVFYGFNVDNGGMGIRPALWINL